MSLMTFAPGATVCLISGYQLQGWNKISVVKNNPVYKQIRGIRSKNTRMRIPGDSAVITIDLYQTSDANDAFSACLQRDNLSRTVRLDITISNPTTRSTVGSVAAYVIGYPEYVIEGDLSVVRWQLACDECRVFIGGNKSAAMGMIEGGISKLKSFTSDVIGQAKDVVGGISDVI